MTSPDPGDSELGRTDTGDGHPNGAFEYCCPHCGLRLEDFCAECPDCGEQLGELYSATYRVQTPAGARVIARVVLATAVILMLIVAAVLLSQWLRGSPG